MKNKPRFIAVKLVNILYVLGFISIAVFIYVTFHILMSANKTVPTYNDLSNMASVTICSAEDYNLNLV